MITFVALEHMVDSTQQMGLGWGWGVITFVALEHMVGTTQQLGLGLGGMFQHSLHLNTWLMLRRWNNKPNLLEALANLAKKTNNRAV